jgi:hypothetical protein
MTNIKIGKTEKELDADQIFQCRNIVRNIIKFGVTEKQKIKLIQLLALELESRDSLKIINDAVESIYSLDEKSKFSLNSEETEYTKNKPKLLDV